MTLAIASDQQTARELLRQIAQLCARHGAQWHPQLEVDVDHGAMRLLVPPGTTGPLISMPTDLLVPIAGAQWSDSADALRLLESPPEATAVQRELLQLHAELYNTTGKLHWWRNQHPARLVDTSPTVRKVVRSV